MIRYDDWHARLGAHIKAALQRPFSWGRNDCCTFACDGILAMTGADPMADLRGKYNSDLGAARALRRFAGGGLEEAAEHIARLLHAPEVLPSLAARGDCALVETTGPCGMALGLVAMNGRQVLVPGPIGLSALPLRNCRRAWKV